MLTEVGENVVTSRAETIRHATDEDMTWQESPSLLLLVGPVLKYLLIVAALFYASLLVNAEIGLTPSAAQLQGNARAEAAQPPGLRSPRKAATAAPGITPATERADLEIVANVVAWLPFAVAAFLCVRLLVQFLRLKTTTYSASSQRLVVESGILNKVNVPFELHHLGDAVIVKPLLLRLFGIANMAIVRPPILLRGLRNADYVRDLLRTGGQLEAQRFEKARWR